MLVEEPDSHRVFLALTCNHAIKPLAIVAEISRQKSKILCSEGCANGTNLSLRAAVKPYNIHATGSHYRHTILS
jgi:hypothetical protein